MRSNKGFCLILVILLIINLTNGIPRSLELEKQAAEPVKEDRKAVKPVNKDNKRT